MRRNFPYRSVWSSSGRREARISASSVCGNQSRSRGFCISFRQAAAVGAAQSAPSHGNGN